MRLDYDFKSALVKRICYVSHKGKRPHYDHPVHSHDIFAVEFIYVDYGKLILNVDNERIVINTGESIFIPGETDHSFIGESEAAVDYLNILFIGDLPENILKTSLHIFPKGQALLEIIKHETEDLLPYHNEFIACCLSQLIICFIRWKNNAIPHKFPESATQLNYRSEIVKRAMTFIEQEYQRPLSLKQLSLAVACSESYLRALIKKETGSNFSTILQKQRILAAKHFLRESTHSLEEIAFAVGYNSLPFFFKVFKRWTGMTPMEYSRSLGEPNDNARK